ncbi:MULTISPECIES: hypothetical protein [unclassified Moraxella]|uniref:hypothetical protein n=1 Tax=unclassified Moraxella TaxID=2685852 RepID=UPI002B413DA7|nr:MULTISPECIES: hypothetical protein [unclassified Moraxella]
MPAINHKQFAKSRFSKNRLSLDVVLHHHAMPTVWLVYSFVSLVLAWQAKLPWVMIGAVFVVVVLLSFMFISRPKVIAFSCTHIDELWDIKVLTWRGRILYQGYLVDIQEINVTGRALFLKFYAIEPKRRTLDVVVHRTKVKDDDFRRLLGLCAINTSSFV